MEVKDDTLEVAARNINKIAKAKGLTPKQLAEQAGISYTTLVPILKGSRDFRVSSLITIANALNITPNDLLSGAYEPNEEVVKPKEPKYLACFITDTSLTYFQLLNLKTKHIETKIFSFSISCPRNAFDTINLIKTALTNTISKDIDYHEIYIYASVLGYEHLDGRAKLEEYATKNFGKFIIEPDWMLIHKSIMPKSNGILITINEGYAISYSSDQGKTIGKHQGYSFPISDEAGNFWLGCEAIKHAINVVEGVEPRSLLSNRILGLVNSDLNLLATKVYDNPRSMYTEAASIVKELSSEKEKAYKLVELGFNNIWEHIKRLDKLLNKKLPVHIAGHLGPLYSEFIPQERFIKTTFEEMLKLQFEHATNALKSQIKS